MRSFLSSLNPRLPRAVQLLQAGGLMNAFGNGLVVPFLLIYLHNERGIGLGVAGLILATNAGVSLVAGPVSGAFVDRVGGKTMLTIALGFLMLGFVAYAFVESPWHGFAASAVTGIGNGAFWPAQSTLLAGLTTRVQRSATFAMQRVVMNLGIGLGGVAGGFIATESFRALFLLDALTFVAYAAVLTVFVHEPTHKEARAERSGSYRTVFRHKVFMALLVLNALYISAGIAQLEILPAFAKNEVGVTERGIGWLFFINTAVVVVLQLPTTRLLEGRRRVPFLALIGVVSAVAWLLVPASGLWLSGAAAFALIALAVAVFAVAECLHGAVQPSARGRSRRSALDRALHGDLGALLAGRLHHRPRGRGRAARGFADRALADDGLRHVCHGRRDARARARACPRACDGRRAARMHRSRSRWRSSHADPESAQYAG